MPVFAAQALEVTASNEVILGTFSGGIQVWKPLSRKTQPRRTLRFPSTGLDALCVLGRDLGVSATGWKPVLRLWNPRTAAVGPEVYVPGGGVTSLGRFGPEHLLCGSKDGTLSIWTIETLIAEMSETLTRGVYAIAPFDATTAVATSVQGTVQVWNASDRALVRTLEGHSASVSSVCALASERIAASYSDDTVRIWNPKTGELIRTLECPERRAS